MNKYVQNKGGEFQKIQEFFKKEIATLRTGRANPALLEGVQVDAYGSKMALSGVASINISDSRSMVVAPWDKTVLKDIEKAITEADLGLGVVNEGDKIRLTLPIMTEENRRNLVKKLDDKMEDARIRVRQMRDEIKKEIEEAEKDKDISEDDRYKFIEELDEETRKQNEILKEIRDKKEEEIMTI